MNTAISMLATILRRRTPWWAWLLAAAFLIWCAFGFYNSLMGIGGQALQHPMLLAEAP